MSQQRSTLKAKSLLQRHIIAVEATAREFFQSLREHIDLTELRPVAITERTKTCS